MCMPLKAILNVWHRRLIDARGRMVSRGRSHDFPRQPKKCLCSLGCRTPSKHPKVFNWRKIRSSGWPGRNIVGIHEFTINTCNMWPCIILLKYVIIAVEKRHCVTLKDDISVLDSNKVSRNSVRKLWVMLAHTILFRLQFGQLPMHNSGHNDHYVYGTN